MAWAPRFSHSAPHTLAILLSSPTSLPSQAPCLRPPRDRHLLHPQTSSIDAALSEYKKTGKELLDHQLAVGVRRCDSVDAVLAIFQGQAEAFQKFRAGDQRLMKWISPVVGVLYKFSETLGGVVGTAFPPVSVIFTGIGILLAATKDVRVSHGALVELIERIENFFKRFGVYTQISLTIEIGEVLVKIVSEVLCILSLRRRK
ncbi:hypothetical protein EDB83DRAFT_1641333 [Lactarius deliciosus]|nr:hypothetical protein EDB83DRAFT_1641333 [Lactarius deliciosus]